MILTLDAIVIRVKVYNSSEEAVFQKKVAVKVNEGTIQSSYYTGTQNDLGVAGYNTGVIN